jgi:hypothetical protein
MNSSKSKSNSEKCVFCYYEKGHTIKTCIYSKLRAKEISKELILLITYRSEFKYDPHWYAQDLMDRYISKRDLDALIDYHSSDLQTYIDQLIEEKVIVEKNRILNNYPDKIFIVGCYYYDNVENGTFKINKEDIPIKTFQMKTKNTTETCMETTFDCPICLSNIPKELCVMYDKCNHKICSDCFCEMTKQENKIKITNIHCCLCRNNVNTILFLDENTRKNVLSNYKIKNKKHVTTVSIL